MALKLSWQNIVFETNEKGAALFGKMKLSAEQETEDKDDMEDDPQGYVERKKGKPAEIELTAILHASLGIDVRDYVNRLLHSAQRDKRDFLYIGNGKLFPFKVLLTKAETEEIKFSPSGVWVSANVKLTFKQSNNEKIIPDPPPPPVTKPSGSGSSGGSSGSGSSGSKPPPPKKPVDTLTNMVNSGKMTPQQAVEYAKNHGGKDNDGKYYG